jgi:glycosyltransferase involved in cell wall biosynthesis
MKLLFHLPEIFQMKTGGNIYNQQIISNLRSHFTVETVTVNASGKIELAPRSGKTQDAVQIIDTLLLKNSSFLEKLKNHQGKAHSVLLVHYLNIFEPGKMPVESQAREREWLPYFDGFITTSNYTKNTLLRENINGNKIGVVRPGLEKEYFAPPPVRTPHPYIEILTVSSIFPGKGLPEFLDMLSSLKNLPWHWTLAGEQSLDQNYFKEFRQKLEDTGLGERVLLSGPLPRGELLRLYESSDIFALPSEFETCSMVTMEAMARGLPVVAYGTGGIPELAQDSGTLPLIPLGDKKAFGAALEKLIQFESYRQLIGKAAFEISRPFPTWEDSAAKFAEHVRRFAQENH